MSGRAALLKIPNAFQLLVFGGKSQQNCAQFVAASHTSSHRLYASKADDQTNDHTEQPNPAADPKLEAIMEELNKVKEEKDSLLDKYKRALAESENMRVRLTKQIDDAKVYGIQGFCKDLLEVADILGNATAAVPKEEVNDKNPHLKNLYEGLCLTQSSLLQVFKRHGLVPMNPLNEKFNPNLHEALFQVPSKSAEPNTVIEVTKLGYKLHDRCIRPALVGVAKTG